MTTTSRIEWTEQTWNPTIGCTKLSAGCKHCYAETLAKRLQAMGLDAYRQGFRLKLLPERLDEPRQRKKPTIYFVNSMSDLFHERIPDDFLDAVMAVIRDSLLAGLGYKPRPQAVGAKVPLQSREGRATLDNRRY